MITYIIGKRSLLSKNIHKKIIKSKIISSDEFLKIKFKSKFNLIINLFYPSTKIKSLVNYNEGIILKSFRTELQHFFKNKIYLEEIKNDEKISATIPFNKKFIQFIFYKKRITTSRNHIFLGWQIISSLILIIISMIFLKNQIKPIINLAKGSAKTVITTPKKVIERIDKRIAPHPARLACS